MSLINIFGGDTTHVDFGNSKVEEPKGGGDHHHGGGHHAKEMLKKLGDMCEKLSELFKPPGGDDGTRNDPSSGSPNDKTGDFLKATGQFFEQMGKMSKA